MPGAPGMVSARRLKRGRLRTPCFAAPVRAGICLVVLLRACLPMLLHTSQHFPGGSGAYTTFFLTLLLTGLLTGSAAVFIFVTTSRGPDRLVSRLGTLLGAATSALLLFVPHATGIV